MRFFARNTENEILLEAFNRNLSQLLLTCEKRTLRKRYIKYFKLSCLFPRKKLIVLNENEFCFIIVNTVQGGEREEKKSPMQDCVHAKKRVHQVPESLLSVNSQAFLSYRKKLIIQSPQQ